MSIRPSIQYRQSSLQNNQLPSNINYVILGNTVLSTIYAKKLFDSVKHQSTPPPIYLMSTGNNLVTDVHVEDLDFIPANNATIGRALETQRLHLILDNNEPIVNNVSDLTSHFLLDQFVPYLYGSGPLGDFISAPIIAAVGPYFLTDSKNQIQNFTKTYTIQYELTDNELIVANNLASLLNLAKSKSIIATKPTILMLNNLFVYHENNKLVRQLFREDYTELQAEAEVETVNHLTKFFIQPSEENCLYNVTYSTLKDPNTNVTIDNACVIFMNDLYEYVKIMGLSNVQHKKLQIPAFYRIVFSIPNVNSTGVNLSNLNPKEYPLNIGDNVSTRLTFTCCDVLDANKNMNQLTPTWNVLTYTTSEDLYIPGNRSVYAAPGKSLLVIEAISLVNRRVTEWDSNFQSVSSGLNSNNLEQKIMQNFLLLASNIFLAYVGNPPELPIIESVCTSDGVCTDSIPLVLESNRESTLIMVMRLLTSLFSGSSYPTSNHNSGTVHCCG